MGLYKVSLLLAIVSVSAKADFHFERFKSFNFHGDDSFRKPWFFEEYARPYQQEPTDLVPSYSSPYTGNENPNEAPVVQPERYESPVEAYFAASTKKVPLEDKSFKKAISPFYTITDKDSERYKSIVLKAKVPYCQETRSKGPPPKRFRRDAMTCYKCKDPKNGATYEQCSYTSEPQESVQVGEYVAAPSAFRYRRSSTNVETSKVGNLPSSDGAVKESPYRFGEEYFAPAASDEIPAEYKDRMENCEKVVKGSMVCMVCKDAKTNGKYEQCSYTTQPNEKAFSYTKSNSFGKDRPEEEAETVPNEDTENSKPVKVYESPGGNSGTYPEAEKYFAKQKVAVDEHVPRYGSSGADENADQRSDSESVTSGNCKKVTKDSMTCTVCKDPKTGGNYEQCSYSHQPNDKVYQFSKQKTFGSGGEAEKPTRGKYSEETEKYGEASQERPYEAPTYGSDAAPDAEYKVYDGGNYGQDDESLKFYQQPTEKRNSRLYAPYKALVDDVLSDSGAEAKSESEKISEGPKSDDCHKVEKDSMTCTVCKDHEKGGSYEQCSYAYQPNDKLYSYTRAKSFGSPDDEGRDAPRGSYKHSEHTDGGRDGFTTDDKPYVASDDTRREAYDFPDAEKDDGKRQGEAPAQLGADFFSTSEKKEAIQKVLQEFQKEDRSKCKKVIRDKMTCYQCVDEQGFQKEECMFVTGAQPKNNRLAYHEMKQFKLDPTAASSGAPEEYRITGSSDTRPFGAEYADKKKKRKKTKKAELPAEQSPAASETQEKRAEPEREPPVEEEASAAEAEPYDYASETRPRYDKVLGLTLPEYMLATSEHEAEFDRIVADGRI